MHPRGSISLFKTQFLLKTHSQDLPAELNLVFSNRLVELEILELVGGFDCS